jgi:hypothetical protein
MFRPLLLRPVSCCLRNFRSRCYFFLLPHNDLVYVLRTWATAHFVECLTKIHNQAIGLSVYIQVVCICDVIDKLHQLGITGESLPKAMLKWIWCWSVWVMMLLVIMCSMILQAIQYKSVIPDGSLWHQTFFLFLKIGQTNVVFHMFGTSPVS